MSRLTDELMNSAPWASTEERAEWWRNKCYEVFEELEHYRHLEEQGELVVQKHGHWIKSRKYYDDGYTVIGACSVCGLEFQAKLLRKICYCPHCGAKMDEVE